MNITVTGGAGYVGTRLVPLLREAGHDVVVLDTFWFGDHLPVTGGPGKIIKIEGDIRSRRSLMEAFRGADAVIHLACVSNDPSFELNPDLGKSINWDCFPKIIEEARNAGVKKFIYASSSSVYGVSDAERVHEGIPCQPLTDYSKYKLACEDYLRYYECGDMEWTILRPATVCGWSPRMRLDLVVNIMTYTALTEGVIRVHGGEQQRPNLHVQDMARAYLHVLGHKTNRQTYNVGARNFTLNEIARKIVHTFPRRVIHVKPEPSTDPRSYRITSDFIFQDIGFMPTNTITSAIQSIDYAMLTGLLPDKPLKQHSNIQRMKEIFP